MGHAASTVHGAALPRKTDRDDFSMANSKAFGTSFLSTLTADSKSELNQKMDSSKFEQKMELRDSSTSDSIKQEISLEFDVHNVSLDAYMSNFKEKYAILQKQHYEKIAQMEENLSKLSSENAVLTSKSQRDNLEKQNLFQKYANLENSMKIFKDESGARELALVTKLEKLTTIIGAKEKQHLTAFETTNEEIGRLRVEVQKLQNEIEEKDVKLKQTRELLELLQNNVSGLIFCF